ncbi:hypothetical protein CDD81_3431 [Ophiocordyceps australis]|uniref:Uncharacterized protein n=1 Tax=Ophiocordyceps australis TaxID=1399860 RepID=A0A2C5YBN6_9HYPO|nr:hypothetical protein CDD81_3431 [Ophiocordyceps australis]
MPSRTRDNRRSVSEAPGENLARVAMERSARAATAPMNADLGPEEAGNDGNGINGWATGNNNSATGVNNLASAANMYPGNNGMASNPHSNQSYSMANPSLTNGHMPHPQSPEQPALDTIIVAPRMSGALPIAPSMYPHPQDTQPNGYTSPPTLTLSSPILSGARVHGPNLPVTPPEQTGLAAVQPGRPGRGGPSTGPRPAPGGGIMDASAALQRAMNVVPGNVIFPSMRLAGGEYHVGTEEHGEGQLGVPFGNEYYGSGLSVSRFFFFSLLSLKKQPSLV